MRGRFGVQLALGLLLSALLIWLSVRTLDVGAAVRALAGANWLWFVPICLVTLLAFWIRAVRWGWLLKSVKPIGAGSLFSATMIGFMANNLLPARLGELVRPWALGTSEKVSRSSVFATRGSGILGSSESLGTSTTFASRSAATVTVPDHATLPGARAEMR